MANRNGRKLGKNVDFETVTETAEETEGPKLVKETDFGGIYQSTFSITVSKKVKNPETGKMEDKEVYSNKEEPFEYPKVNSIANAIVHAGGKLTGAQIDALAKALTAENGPAVLKLTKVYNDKIKADAKSSAYQSLVAKHKPLEGEEKEVAFAKIIRGLVRATNFTAEAVIEMLKNQKALPADYSVEDYNTTKMRKTKGSEEDEE